MKGKAKTKTLDMFPDLPVPVAPSKIEKDEKKRRKGEEQDRRRTERERARHKAKSLGKEVPQLKTSDGSPIACPCGRVYLLARVDGGYIFFDKEGSLGASSLGGGYVMRNYAKAVRLVEKHGCYLHERERERAVSRDATACNLQVDLPKLGG
jgi:hypothetical protein